MENNAEDFSEDVKVRTKGQDGAKFHDTAVHNNTDKLPKCNDINNHFSVKPTDQKHHQIGNGSGAINSETMFQDVDSDEDVFHRVNGLYNDNVVVHSYHDNPNSNSDSDDIVYDRKDSFDGTEALFQTKPLMHPRKRAKVKTRQGQGLFYKCVWPVIYVLLAIGAVVALVFIVIYLVGFLAGKYSIGGGTLQNIVGCSHMSKTVAWTSAIPKLMTESSIRMVDVNKDGVLDILFGFATGSRCL